MMLSLCLVVFVAVNWLNHTQLGLSLENSSRGGT